MYLFTNWANMNRRERKNTGRKRVRYVFDSWEKDLWSLWGLRGGESFGPEGVLNWSTVRDPSVKSESNRSEIPLSECFLDMPPHFPLPLRFTSFYIPFFLLLISFLIFFILFEPLKPSQRWLQPSPDVFPMGITFFTIRQETSPQPLSSSTWLRSRFVMRNNGGALRCSSFLFIILLLLLLLFFPLLLVPLLFLCRFIFLSSFSLLLLVFLLLFFSWFFRWSSFQHLNLFPPC